MAQVSKGVLAVVSLLSLVINIMNDTSLLIPNSDITPLFWYMWTFTLMFFGTTVGLMQKYGLQSMVAGLSGAAIESGLLKEVAANFVPDLFTGVVPLYMTFLRLDKYRTDHFEI